MSDPDATLLDELYLPAVAAELSRTDAEYANETALRRLDLVRDLTDAEMDERDEEQALARWVSRAFSD